MFSAKMKILPPALRGGGGGYGTFTKVLLYIPLHIVTISTHHLIKEQACTFTLYCTVFQTRTGSY
jgi:hypothetical protein